MKIKFIRIVSPKDAGCEISDEEHAAYCELVAESVSSAYDCPVEVEMADIFTTTVFISSDDYTGGLRETIKSMCQDIWEQGGFWQ